MNLNTRLNRSRCTSGLVGTLACALWIGITGCSSSSPANRCWDGHVYQWGTMHEVLGEGHTQGRVRLDDAVHDADAIGVGALANLQGEVTIMDGHAWIARGSPATVESVNDQATLLAMAHVPQWTRTLIETEMTGDQLDAFIRETARSKRIEIDKPFPFIVEGRLNVVAHVVSGACPHANNSPQPAQVERPPFQIKNEVGWLVGFYAENGQGSLTHHGSRTHIHVLMQGDQPRTGHVDSATVAAGAVIRLPVVRNDQPMSKSVS